MTRRANLKNYTAIHAKERIMVMVYTYCKFHCLSVASFAYVGNAGQLLYSLQVCYSVSAFLFAVENFLMLLVWTSVDMFENICSSFIILFPSHGMIALITIMDRIDP